MPASAYHMNADPSPELYLDSFRLSTVQEMVISDAEQIRATSTLSNRSPHGGLEPVYAYIPYS